LNVPRLSKLYFLYNMLPRDCLNPGSFLVSHLHSVATSFVQRIVIRGLITPIARYIGIDPNADDRALDSEH